MWDESKKTFKKKKIGIDGEIISEDHKQILKDKKRIEHMQSRYKNWKKNSSLNFLKVGDREEASNTAKATSSFKNRMNKKQIADSIKRKRDHNSKIIGVKANKYGKKEGFMKGRKVQSELKSFNQIIKDKAKKKFKTQGKGKDHKGRGKKHK